MNFQKKLLSLAILGIVLAAPVAHAAIDPGANSGNGELFFALWHDNATSTNSDDTSYVRDLGIGINDLVFTGRSANTNYFFSPTT